MARGIWDPKRVVESQLSRGGAVPTAGGPGPKVTETGVSLKGGESRLWRLGMPCLYAYAREGPIESRRWALGE